MNKFDVKKDTIKSILAAYKIIIPDFQRKLSWNDNKKIELIDSLINGFPIGAFTLFSDNDDNGYYLVDGLQRYNTIVSYLTKPSAILPFNSYYEMINDEIEVFSNNNIISLKKLKSAIKEWYKKLDTNLQDEVDKKYAFENFALLSNCLNNNNVELNNDFSKFQNLRDILLKNIDIRDEVLALIIYSGPKDDLPEIFTKINQKNISLTPYEILHSMWFKYSIGEQDSEYDYKKLFEDFISSNSDYKNTEVNSFNVFMYMTSLGYLYREDIKKIDSKEEVFKKIKNVIKPEIIFDAFSLVFSKKSNRINSVIYELCNDKECREYENIIFSVGKAILYSLKSLNEIIYNHKLDFINSRYMYLYLFYIKFRNNYILDKNQLIISKITGKIYVDDDFINKINKENWFRGENRQLTFFSDRIEDIEELLKNRNKVDSNAIFEQYYKHKKNNL